jgi:hypothetical protein
MLETFMITCIRLNPKIEKSQNVKSSLVIIWNASTLLATDVSYFYFDNVRINPRHDFYFSRSTTRHKFRLEFLLAFGERAGSCGGSTAASGSFPIRR